MTRGIRIAVLGLMTLLWSAALLPAQYRQGGSWDGGRQQRWVQPDRSSYRERSNYREYTNYKNDDYGYTNRYNNDRYNNDRFYNDRRGRSPGASAAIIAGSAGAGAAIGAVSGGGKGAAIGAVIGGVSGLIIDQSTKHRRR